MVVAEGTGGDCIEYTLVALQHKADLQPLRRSRGGWLPLEKKLPRGQKGFAVIAECCVDKLEGGSSIRWGCRCTWRQGSKAAK